MRVHLPDQLGEHRRLVAGAGADLEHDVLRRGAEQVGHQRHDEGLRDGLAVADRQRAVLVGAGGLLGGDEGVARHAAHRRQHARVDPGPPPRALPAWRAWSSMVATIASRAPTSQAAARGRPPRQERERDRRERRPPVEPPPGPAVARCRRRLRPARTGSGLRHPGTLRHHGSSVNGGPNPRARPTHPAGTPFAPGPAARRRARQRPLARHAAWPPSTATAVRPRSDEAIALLHFSAAGRALAGYDRPRRDHWRRGEPGMSRRTTTNPDSDGATRADPAAGAGGRPARRRQDRHGDRRRGRGVPPDRVRVAEPERRVPGRPERAAPGAVGRQRRPAAGLAAGGGGGAGRRARAAATGSRPRRSCCARAARTGWRRRWRPRTRRRSSWPTGSRSSRRSRSMMASLTL